MPTSNLGRWRAGQSGNRAGRPLKSRTLTELLRLKGSDILLIGGEEVPAQEALAKAVWHFVTTGEVQLAGKHLVAQSATEWAAVVKWLYTYVEPPISPHLENEPEMVVHVVRVDKHLPTSSNDDSESD